jgi:hypothetical protein
MPTDSTHSRRRDAAGRTSLPLEQAEGSAPEAWHANLALPCVVPAGVRERAELAAARKVGTCRAGWAWLGRPGR